MSQWLKQSTVVTVQLGPFLDTTDGFTPEVALAITQADIRLSMNGGAFAQATDANAAAHDENGWYRKQLDATDTGTLGRLIVAVYEAGALPVWREFMVVPANEYDSLISGSDSLEVDTIEISGDAVAANNAESFFDGTGYAGTGNTIPTVTTVGTTTTNTDMRGTDNAALAATALTDATWTDAKAGFLDAAISTRTKPADTQARVTLVDTVTTNTDVRGTDNAALAATALTDATWTDARAGYLDNLNIAEDVAGTSEISALNDLSAAQVNAEVVDALATDTYAEPGQEAPGATVSLATKINYVYKAFRNKLTQTAATLSIYNDAGAVVDQKATVSDDGVTFTRGEIGTGP